MNIQLALLTAKLGGLGEIKEAVSAIEKQQATYRSTSESIVDLKSDVKSLDGTVSTLSEQIIRLQVELQYLRERKEGASE